MTLIESNMGVVGVGSGRRCKRICFQCSWRNDNIFRTGTGEILIYSWKIWCRLPTMDHFITKKLDIINQRPFQCIYSYPNRVLLAVNDIEKASEYPHQSSIANTDKTI